MAGLSVAKQEIDLRRADCWEARAWAGRARLNQPPGRTSEPATKMGTGERGGRRKRAWGRAERKTERVKRKRPRDRWEEGKREEEGGGN